MVVFNDAVSQSALDAIKKTEEEERRMKARRKKKKKREGLKPLFKKVDNFLKNKLKIGK